MIWLDIDRKVIDDPTKLPEYELVMQAVEIHNQLVTKIFTTLDDDGTIVIHNTGCPLIYSETPYDGVLPYPEEKRTRDCKCMPQLSDIMASLKH
jgi:hypothetical protein